MLLDFLLDEISLTVTIEGRTAPHVLRFEKVPTGWDVRATFPPEDRMRAMVGWPFIVRRNFLNEPAEDRQDLLKRFQRWDVPNCPVQKAFWGYSASFREFLMTGIPEEAERKMDEEDKESAC